jgi:RHS repeat-associated protein
MAAGLLYDAGTYASEEAEACFERSYYYRARYYEPTVGRFLSEDLFSGNGDHSLYSYVRNNPAQYIDPSGMVPEKPCDCKGNSGGVKAAYNCCRNAPAISATEGAPPYDPCFSYIFVNANFMYRNGGGSGWGNVVRGCLKCAYQYGTDSSAAHALCYAVGYERTRSAWDGLTYGLTANYGLGRAVGGAVASLGSQIINFVDNRGKKPFTCLNVK